MNECRLGILVLDSHQVKFLRNDLSLCLLFHGELIMRLLYKLELLSHHFQLTVKLVFGGSQRGRLLIHLLKL